MKKGLIVTSFVVMAVTIPAQAAVWYVDKDNTGTENGTSWATAFKTVQAGIDAAYNDGGGEVWVAEGVYTGLVSPIAIMKPNVNIYGGFVGIGGEETQREQRNWTLHSSVIDGENADRRGIEGASNAILDGVTITRARYTSSLGGGMWNSGVTSLTIQNCVISFCFSPNGAGGIGCQGGSTVLVRNCRFEGNSCQSYWGGGLDNQFSTLTVENSAFVANGHEFSAGCSGGAICTRGGTTYIRSCQFSDNWAGLGGAVFTNATTNITNSTFWANKAFGSGSTGRGGALTTLGGNFDVTNCTFLDSSTEDLGGCIYCSGSGGNTVSLKNCIL